ncbi:MAG: hypothetical protein JSW03_05545 [Candidatus Eiseniibacteriota bacterium]|nr:MAG: hypothetical protein JSW03_05545 [Candidatus Eisenbacteria bacterium]
MAAGRTRLLILGEACHARDLKEQLDENFGDKLNVAVQSQGEAPVPYGQFDVFHLISSPLPSLRDLARFRRPMVYHWIGTDVYRILKDSAPKRWMNKRLIQKIPATHVVVSQGLKKELETVGVSSEIYPLAGVQLETEPPPLPKKFSVLSYVPQRRWKFYGGDAVLEVAKQLPEVDFHLLAAGSVPPGLPNVRLRAFSESPAGHYRDTSVLLRFTEHDGLPKMLLEALSNGRHVLWTQPFPHCHTVESVAEALDLLRSLSRNTELNREGREYVDTHYSPSKLAQDILSLYERILKVK